MLYTRNQYNIILELKTINSNSIKNKLNYKINSSKIPLKKCDIGINQCDRTDCYIMWKDSYMNNELPFQEMVLDQWDFHMQNRQIKTKSKKQISTYTLNKN